MSFNDVRANYAKDDKLIIQTKRPHRNRQLTIKKDIAMRPYLIVKIDLTITPQQWKHLVIIIHILSQQKSRITF